MAYLVMHAGIMEGIYLSSEKAKAHVEKAEWVEDHGEWYTADKKYRVVYWSDNIGTGEYIQ